MSISEAAVVALSVAWFLFICKTSHWSAMVLRGHALEVPEMFLKNAKAYFWFGLVAGVVIWIASSYSALLYIGLYLLAQVVAGIITTRAIAVIKKEINH